MRTLINHVRGWTVFQQCITLGLLVTTVGFTIIYVDFHIRYEDKVNRGVRGQELRDFSWNRGWLIGVLMLLMVILAVVLAMGRYNVRQADES